MTLDVQRELLRDGGILLFAVEPAGDLIDRHHLFDRNVAVDRRQNAVVILDVELVVGRHEQHVGAKPPRLVHQRAGLDAEGLGGVAGCDGAGRLRHRRHDDDRLAPERRILLLLAGREETVQIKNQPAQHTGPPWRLKG